MESKEEVIKRFYDLSMKELKDTLEWLNEQGLKKQEELYDEYSNNLLENEEKYKSFYTWVFKTKINKEV